MEVASPGPPIQLLHVLMLPDFERVTGSEENFDPQEIAQEIWVWLIEPL